MAVDWILLTSNVVWRLRVHWKAPFGNKGLGDHMTPTCSTISSPSPPYTICMDNTCLHLQINHFLPYTHDAIAKCSVSLSTLTLPPPWTKLIYQVTSDPYMFVIQQFPCLFSQVDVPPFGQFNMVAIWTKCPQNAIPIGRGGDWYQSKEYFVMSVFSLSTTLNSPISGMGIHVKR